MVDKTNIAEVYGRSLPISTKFSVEICNAIRYKELSKAKKILDDIISMRRALPIRRYNRDMSHKKMVGPGRYPIKSSVMFLRLLDSVEANASNKGLDVNNLIINFAKADRAERKWRGGRKGRVSAKNTHVRIIVEERKAEGGIKK